MNKDHQLQNLCFELKNWAKYHFSASNQVRTGQFCLSTIHVNLDDLVLAHPIIIHPTMV